MKKVLSVFLAVLMLFGALSVSSFAEETTGTVVTPPMAYHDWWGEGGPCNEKQVVILFNLNSGSLQNETQVYNEETGKFEWKQGKDIVGSYYMVPKTQDEMVAGTGAIVLPVVTAPEGQQFYGWTCMDCPGNTSYVGQTFSQGTLFDIPSGCAGTMIQFKAFYGPADIEEPTLTKVVGILMKIFGTIIGLIAYGGDTKQGIAFMEKVFGGLFD